MNLSINLIIPWLLIGDFNDISKNSEKFGGGPPSQTKLAFFSTFLNTYKLVDLGFIGHPFTWTNGGDRNQIIRTHIDRVHATPN